MDQNPAVGQKERVGWEPGGKRASKMKKESWKNIFWRSATKENEPKSWEMERGKVGRGCEVRRSGGWV